LGWQPSTGAEPYLTYGEHRSRRADAQNVQSKGDPMTRSPNQQPTICFLGSFCFCSCQKTPNWK